MKKFNILFSKEEKRRFLFLFVLMFFGGILDTLSVSLMVPFVTMLMPEEVEESEILNCIKALGIELTDGFIIKLLIAMVFLYIAKNVYLSFEYWVQSKFINGCKVRIKKKLFDSYLSQDYEYFLNVDSGYVINIINLNVEWTFIVVKNFLNMFIEIIVAMIIGISLFIIDPSMTFMLAALLLAETWLISRVLEPAIRKKSQEYNQNQAIANTWVLQTIRGIKEVMVSGKKSFFANQFEKYSKTASEAQVSADFLSSLPRNIVEALTMSGILIYILAFVKSGYSINTLIPQMSAFIMAAIRLIPSFNRISSAKTQIAYGERGLDSVVSKIQMYEQHDESASNLQVSMGKKCELESITYSYANSDKPVLEEAGMEIPVGSFVGIIGPSGEGKTTAVDLLIGLLKPQAGKVLTDGEDIGNNYEQWLGYIGYVPQSIFLMDTGIRENVAFGVPEEEIDDEKVENALKSAQLWEFIQTLPKGTETTIGEAGVRLSGGQRQRIGIARALYRDPKIIIMDEATSALDSKTESEIMEAIEMLHGKKTLVVIAHRTSTLAKCDIRYRVEGRKIIREL